MQHYREAALRTDSISLDRRASNKVSDGAADDLGNQIGEKSTPNPEDTTQAFYMKGKVTALLATLKDREQKVSGLHLLFLPLSTLLMIYIFFPLPVAVA